MLFCHHIFSYLYEIWNCSKFLMIYFCALYCLCCCLRLLLIKQHKRLKHVMKFLEYGTLLLKNLNSFWEKCRKFSNLIQSHIPSFSGWKRKRMYWIKKIAYFLSCFSEFGIWLLWQIQLYTYDQVESRNSIRLMTKSRYLFTPIR